MFLRLDVANMYRSDCSIIVASKSKTVQKGYNA